MTPTACARGVLKRKGSPKASVTVAPASAAISAAAATSHSNPQRSVATRSARSSATSAMRSAMLFGLVTMIRSRSTRSEEHTSELQSLMRISYAVFCLKKKNKDANIKIDTINNYTTKHKQKYQDAT